MSMPGVTWPTWVQIRCNRAQQGMGGAGVQNGTVGIIEWWEGDGRQWISYYVDARCHVAYLGADRMQRGATHGGGGGGEWRSRCC